MPAPLPPDEKERLTALAASGSLTEESDAELEAVVRRAAFGCRAAGAMLSLVDATQVVSKASFGKVPSRASRDSAPCAYAILDGELFTVADLAKDPRFQHVAWPHALSFYAGMPVTVGSYRFGVLCIFDDKPRALTEEDRTLLRDLACEASRRLAGAADRQTASLPLVDEARFWENYADLRAMLPTLLQGLADQVPRLLGRIEAAVQAKDAAALRAAAHGCKGVLLQVFAVRAARIALALEHAGRTGNLEEAAALFAELRHELPLAVAELARMGAAGPGSGA